MAKFPRFTELPVELQDPIWDYAIRDDQPAAHFFSMFYHFPEDTEPAIPRAKCISLPEGSTNLSGLGAPLSEPHTGDYSWSQNNASIYTQDSGLWTACKASRKRILRVFPPTARTAPEEAILTMGFENDKGEQQQLTIRPSSDLVCLQSPYDSKLWRKLRCCSQCSDLFWGQLNENPLFKTPAHVHGAPGPTNAFYALKHIAIEFDPAWAHPESKISCAEFCWLRKMEHLIFFWFIDYRLKRRTTVKHFEHGWIDLVFQARDRIFVEVGPSQGEEWTYGDPGQTFGEHEQQDTLIGSKFQAETAHDWAEYCQENQTTEAPGRVRYPDYYGRFDLMFGVLACESIGSYHGASDSWEADVEGIVEQVKTTGQC